MFGISQDQLIENLEKLQKKSCGYTGGKCDCKFGAEKTGEQTGCPEISQCIAMIKGMDRDSYRDFCYLSDVTILY